MEEEIDLMDMLKYFWKRKIWIILVGVIFVILSIIYTKFLITPEYSATSAFILTNDNLETEADVYSYAKLPDRYFAIANSRAVFDKVITNLKITDIEKLEKFKEECIEITHFPANFLIEVSVTTDNAKKSADIANEIVKVTIEEIDRIYKDKEIQVLDVAKEVWEPVNIELLKNIVMFFLIGEVLICAYMLVCYFFIENSNKKEVEDANKE